MRDKFKLWIIKNISSKYLEILGNKGISTTKIPKEKAAVVSDLFPFRIENDWNTYFELLNIYEILDPLENNLKSNWVKLNFYDVKGNFTSDYKVKLDESLKSTLDIKEITKSLNIKKNGTFAVFHERTPNWLKNLNSFVAERGYIGYENINFGPIKSFIHGNLDAISLENTKKENLLGNYSFFEKEYYLQHELLSNFTYELFWVNTTSKSQKLIIIERSLKKDKSTILIIPPKGVKSYKKLSNENKKNIKIVVKSRLYLARPIIFKYMKNSFDVFHG